MSPVRSRYVAPKNKKAANLAKVSGFFRIGCGQVNSANHPRMQVQEIVTFLNDISGSDAMNGFYAQAESFFQQGSFDKASELFSLVVKNEPNNTAAHYYLGLSLYKLGRVGEGIAHYQAVLASSPNYLDAWINLGDLYAKNGQRPAATAAWQKALQLDPESVLVLGNLGIVCRDQGLKCEALHYFRQAASIAPERHDLWFSIGNVLMDEGRYAQAVSAFQQAIRVNPHDAQTHNNLAVSLGNLGQVDAAIQSYELALACDSGLADGLNNLALALHKKHRREEALHLLQQCTCLHPDYALCWANLGMVLQGLGKPKEAIEAIDRALMLQPNQPGWLWNRALAYLAQGDFVRGWADYESRYAPNKPDSQTFLPEPLDFPMWQGESLNGKRILLVKEQGFGDQIQCLRFCAELAGKGAIVGVWVHPALARLAKIIPGVTEVVTDKPVVSYDYWAYIMSLPVRLGVTGETLPGTIPYVGSVFGAGIGAVRIKSVVDCYSYGRQRVALNWAGNSSHYNDVNRSIDFDLIQALLKIDSIAWISLQKDRGEVGDDYVHSGHLLPLGDDISDFLDTAEILSNIDILITVDSAVAHLAGAMNIKTWLMLPENADYRWMQNRSDTPWYPSIKIFRQIRLGSWESEINSLSQLLIGSLPAS